MGRRLTKEPFESREEKREMQQTQGGALERIFHLREQNTSVKTEVVAGLTTFVTMAYILAVNPLILGDAGMDKGAVFTATCLASMVATICMAFLSNYPFALSAGMGLNAYFAYTVVLKIGYSWQMALAAVFVEGVIFIVLSLTRVREAVFNAIPMSLKHAVSAGIGLFIAFIGMQNCKLVVDSSTLVEMYSFADNRAEFSTVGITVVLAMVGVLITGILVVRGVKGNILWGILATWVLGILCQLTGLYDPSVLGSVLPDFSGGIAVPSVMPTLGQMDFSALLTPEFAVVVFALLFVDVFDTMGGLIGIASKADMLDGQGRLPRLRGALLADAIGTTAGAVLGTSTVTTFAESAAGVAEGGRTGLTALVTGGLFGAALFLSPLFLAVLLRHSPRPDCGGIHDGGFRAQGGLRQSGGRHPRLFVLPLHSLYVLHLRGHCPGRYLLRGDPRRLRPGEPPGGQPRHVCAGTALCAQIRSALRENAALDTGQAP